MKTDRGVFFFRYEFCRRPSGTSAVVVAGDKKSNGKIVPLNNIDVSRYAVRPGVTRRRRFRKSYAPAPEDVLLRRVTAVSRPGGGVLFLRSADGGAAASTDRRSAGGAVWGGRGRGKSVGDAARSPPPFRSDGDRAVFGRGRRYSSRLTFRNPFPPVSCRFAGPRRSPFSLPSAVAALQEQ